MLDMSVQTGWLAACCAIHAMAITGLVQYTTGLKLLAIPGFDIIIILAGLNGMNWYGCSYRYSHNNVLTMFSNTLSKLFSSFSSSTVVSS